MNLLEVGSRPRLRQAYGDRRVVPEALAGDKVVTGDGSTEGSQTAKVCTDEQEEPEGATLWHRFGAYEAYLFG